MFNECIGIIWSPLFGLFSFFNAFLISLIKLILQLKFSTDKKQAKDMGGRARTIESRSVSLWEMLRVEMWFWEKPREWMMSPKERLISENQFLKHISHLPQKLSSKKTNTLRPESEVKVWRERELVLWFINENYSHQFMETRRRQRDREWEAWRQNLWHHFCWSYC